jgi:hypothetical protein
VTAKLRRAVALFCPCLVGGVAIPQLASANWFTPNKLGVGGSYRPWFGGVLDLNLLRLSEVRPEQAALKARDELRSLALWCGMVRKSARLELLPLPSWVGGG